MNQVPLPLWDLAGLIEIEILGYTSSLAELLKRTEEAVIIRARAIYAWPYEGFLLRKTTIEYVAKTKRGIRPLSGRLIYIRTIGEKTELKEQEQNKMPILPNLNLIVDAEASRIRSYGREAVPLHV